MAPNKESSAHTGSGRNGQISGVRRGCETQDRIHQCPDPEAVQHRLSLLRAFLKVLTTMHTAQEIRQCWTSQLHAELRLGEPPASEVIRTASGMAAVVSVGPLEMCSRSTIPETSGIGDQAN